MNPPTATAPSRRPPRRASDVARRRENVRRRRRTAALVVGVVVVIAAVLLVLPVARKAVNELGLPLRYQDVIRQQAADKRLDPAFVAAVIYAETKFDARTSSAGAVGLMQIMPRTALFLAHRSGATRFHVSDLSTPQVNIAYGSYYLRYLLDEYHGSKVLALAAYNGGESNVDGWIRRSPPSRFTVRDIPFPETRAYVERVLGAQQAYRHTYPSQLGYH
jgi:soluble lytic murein transglycosylase